MHKFRIIQSKISYIYHNFIQRSVLVANGVTFLQLLWSEQKLKRVFLHKYSDTFNSTIWVLIIFTSPFLSLLNLIPRAPVILQQNILFVGLHKNQSYFAWRTAIRIRLCLSFSNHFKDL